MPLFYLQDEVAYYHLGAFSEEGYRCRASFALFWTTLEVLSKKARQLDLGGVTMDGAAPRRLRLAAFVSGGGSNLENLLARSESGTLPASRGRSSAGAKSAEARRERSGLDRARPRAKAIEPALGLQELQGSREGNRLTSDHEQGSGSDETRDHSAGSR